MTEFLLTLLSGSSLPSLPPPPPTSPLPPPLPSSPLPSSLSLLPLLVPPPLVGQGDLAVDFHHPGGHLDACLEFARPDAATSLAMTMRCCGNLAGSGGWRNSPAPWVRVQCGGTIAVKVCPLVWIPCPSSSCDRSKGNLIERPSRGRSH
ncbi:hypothetical protein BV898_13125 [Hypsibius exemplaris]|uniref:Uncharacterized protein n=1 Tax=Hypsibius exemplaris TaxID=2072580 RepID=A0A1W0WBP2_HYPEX|nr:hypothetical protein BV898_13125 [Hypsibius exemplaris]